MNIEGNLERISSFTEAEHQLLAMKISYRAENETTGLLYLLLGFSFSRREHCFET
ncbi:hypothetical protein MM221_07090 [Salipaludibacillus sp. LMS25]|jgi:hypothetical protein|uniref:hypothetical protein n=1 Tax=Salipaludibacillus sp. LMS25 TaxID=2924031 RepID=UPI0020D04DCD|nr:hypothetical protein [Salipaludibacillus sp. LMS25]UTR16306.1 hypothetical protein MM221_07090 [Salipaludibacillus sp. LMS25]